MNNTTSEDVHNKLDAPQTSSFRNNIAPALKDKSENLHTENSGLEFQLNQLGYQSRPRGHLGFKYQSEVQIIRSQLGSLEEIRQKLGLSRRKICELLMVDPSAWTRWTRPGEDAPPHIYRALEWYVLLTKNEGAAAHSFWIWNKRGQALNQLSIQNKQNELAFLTNRLTKLEKYLFFSVFFMLFLMILMRLF